MNTFEDKLLTELLDDDVWETRLAPDQAPARRPVYRSPMAWGTVATATAAAAMVVVVAGPSATPAYALTSNSDGTVTLRLNNLQKPSDIKRLGTDLHRAGIGFKVDILPAGKTCADDRGSLAHITWTMNPRDHRDVSTELTSGQTLALVFDGPDHETWMSSVYNGPVAACHPVDDGITTSGGPSATPSGPGAVRESVAPLAPSGVSG